MFEVGKPVKLVNHIYQAPDGDSPGGYFGFAGDKVLVKSIDESKKFYPVEVAHEDVTDGKTFGVTFDEIQQWTDADEAD